MSKMRFWGPPSRRRPRRAHSPLARWREQMATMAHRAATKRWRRKPVTQAEYNAIFAALTAGEIVEYRGFGFIRSRTAS